uniref:Proline-rich transmembrane protein 3/4 domain-containing protein n=1 Tax=Knipowitschia caucasica TaxID=637954 RepID=A0AAV2LX08_KNICA
MTTAKEEESVTEAPVATPQPAVIAGELTANTPSSDRTRPSMDPSPQFTRTGTSSFLTSSVVPGTRPALSPTHQTAVSFKNRSFPLGRPLLPPTVSSGPSPTAVAANATLLYWGDLSRTLAFVWELHVYGTASLFLLLFAGAALGLILSSGAKCPHRGALALANILLFVAGCIRATFFFTDPYGTRKFLPRPAVIALYNLPLHLLVWTQATIPILAMRAAGVSLFPPTLERPPLVAVLAVLHCTLLLASDLLSPALSPVVPVTLQFLSLCWGLVVCVVYLCYIFPHIRCPLIPHAALPDASHRKAWSGSRKLVVILGRVLAVCAVLGALCCCLHAYATLWLYGLLGDGTRFTWGWWLVHFWARLLELAWGFSLLLLASWLFWKPESCRGRDEAGTDGRAAGDVSSAGQSSVSAQRHTCWSKIVQSLKGKPCRKSDSNGVGSAQGEVPNNWAGQDRSAADISKSLIRNQNQSTVPAGPVKDNNRRAHSAERGVSDESAGSLLRLQPFTRPPQRSVSGSQDIDRDTSVSLYEFDLRPPSPIDLTRSIDEALHREHLLTGGSLFHPPLSQTPSPGSGLSQGPWLRRNSDPQLSDSSDATESSMPLGGSIMSSVPSRQVTAPPTPSHQGHKWGGALGSVPSSVSCPVSLRPTRTSSGRLEEDAVDDTRPFITPDSDRGRRRAAKPVGSRSYLEVSRHDDSASVSSEIIDL